MTSAIARPPDRCQVLCGAGRSYADQQLVERLNDARLLRSSDWKFVRGFYIGAVSYPQMRCTHGVGIVRVWWNW